MASINETGPKSKPELVKEYVGRALQDLPVPAAILDRHLLDLQCKLMLDACANSELSFRPHVKTHKETLEGARLQLGEEIPANIVVSTLAEAFHLLPILEDYKAKGRPINVLYGIPLPRSALPRLAQLSNILGPGSVSFMIDNPEQLSFIPDYLKETANPPSIYIKVDVGYHRAGVSLDSNTFKKLLETLSPICSEGNAKFLGLYAHDSRTYSQTTPEAAICSLRDELHQLHQAAETVLRSDFDFGYKNPLMLSVGASPDASSIINLYCNERLPYPIASNVLAELKALLQGPPKTKLELHAGVYAVLDMQQVDTKSRPSPLAPAGFDTSADGLQIPKYVPRDEDESAKLSPLQEKDIALTILAEVVSKYLERDTNQVLVAAGTLALGREPRYNNSSWASLSNWNIPQPTKAFHLRPSGWEASRTSQEHGILEESKGSFDLLHPNQNVFDGIKIGQKVRLFPNHACITGANYPFYFVVDSSSDDPDKVVDIWMRCSGW